MAEISMVIRCCNEERHIGRLLTGIMRQTRRDPEIILVAWTPADAVPGHMPRLSLAPDCQIRRLAGREGGTNLKIVVLGEQISTRA